MINKNITKIIISLIFLTNISTMLAETKVALPYTQDNQNKLYKEFHKYQTYHRDYEEGGSNYNKKYEKEQEKNGVSYSKERITEGDVITCFSGNENLASKNGNKRKFHDIYGTVGENTVKNANAESTIPYDMTSIKSFQEIQEGFNKGYRDNNQTKRYCNSKDLKNGNDGDYDVEKIYCEAGMETTKFLGLVEDPYTLKIPTCQLTLDTDIKIDQVRYLRQVVSPDNSSGDVDDNYSMGNGLVKCSVKNGKLFLEMLENPKVTETCNNSTFSSFDGGCCNPTTGFGCNAQFCQYGANKYCDGKTLPNSGSCEFESKARIFVKGILKVTSKDGSGEGTFKCLENGLWSNITPSSSACK